MTIRLRRERSPRLRASVLALVLATTVPVAAASAADAARPSPLERARAKATSTMSTTSTCATVTVPAYFYAGPTWDAAVSGPASVKRTLILNPSSGPGSQQDPAYVDTVARARAAGARVVGYVHTSYGTRPLDVVADEVARYHSWYGVVDIFFDEVSSSVADLTYYQTLSDRVRSAGGRTLLNPGTHPDEGYMAVGDEVVTFEGTYDTYRRATVPAWTAGYAPSRFTHLVYATTKRQLSSALDLSARRRAGNVYVTNDGGVNPWDTLPSYWQSELSALAARC